MTHHRSVELAPGSFMMAAVKPLKNMNKHYTAETAKFKIFFAGNRPDNAFGIKESFRGYRWHFGTTGRR